MSNERVVGCRMLRLPPMLGYLVVGVVIGPNALALAQNSAGLRHLAEFGVVFLMFVIGLEFSLPKLKAMKRHVFGLGLSQVVLTVTLTTAASLAMGWLLPRWWKMEWQMALALGGVMAMSSTAIVIKMVAERLELESEHGKRVVGVLLFQDLALVPLLVLIPALGSPPDVLFKELGVALFKAAVLLSILLTGGQRFIRWWLTLVARRKSEELFMLNLLLIFLALLGAIGAKAGGAGLLKPTIRVTFWGAFAMALTAGIGAGFSRPAPPAFARSEERRVWKECRSRW